jgi:rhodanese-related sulfurtransferase
VRAIALGYKHVYIMPAGIAGWEKAGLPVATG